MVKTKNTVQNFIDINNISYSFFSFSLSAFFPKLTNFYDRYCIIFQEKKKKISSKEKSLHMKWISYPVYNIHADTMYTFSV